MPTKPSSLFAVLAFACVTTGCATSPSPAMSSDDLVAERLVPFAAAQHTGITPQIDAATGQGDYSLLYRVTDDGKSISTRFLGPSDPVGAPLGMRTELDGDWHSLICFVTQSDYEVTLARWRTDASGRIARAYIRTEPFIEWRALGLKPGQLVTDVEWRPLVDGVGIGEWRN